MSILAERKRKQKWCLNPRGKEWSEDSGKFGQKMLEKMGWSNGKGLGVELDGITEHVKISYKNDSKGMGFKESNDQWTEHEDKFTELLNKLGDTEESVKIDTDKNAVRSLEKKSQTSRARVHYHKFTRGKDLSRYSQKDLANIFGRKTLDEPKKKEIKAEIKQENCDGDEHRFGVETVTGGSMVDYFKKKFNPNFMNSNGFKVGSNGVLQKCESDTESERPSFGFGFNQNNNQTNSIGEYSHFIKSEPEVKDKNIEYGIKYSNNYGKAETKVDLIENEWIEVNEEICSKKKSKKNKKKDETTFVSYVEEEAIIEENEMKKSKKKKKKNKEEPIEEITTKSKKSNKEEPIGEITTKSKKSKKEEFALNNPAFDPTFNEDEIISVIKKSKKKKRKFEEIFTLEDEESSKSKKSKKGIENTCFDDFDKNDPIDEIIENPYEIKQKKKSLDGEKSFISKSKKGVENACFNENELNDEIIENPYEIKETKKRLESEESLKSKKSKKGVENTCFNENDLIDENPYEIKQNKKSLEGEESSKSKKSKKGVENTCFDDSVFDENDPIDEIIDNPYEIKQKKKKRKKSKQLDETIMDFEVKRVNDGLDNPIFDESIKDNENDLKNSDAFEVKRKKKSKKIIENDGPCLATNLDITCDFQLNVTTKPIIITPIRKPEAIRKVSRRKSVRFSDVNEERIIPNNDDNKVLTQKMREELFEINTQVIERGNEDVQLDETACAGFINNGFDLKSHDRESFYQNALETNKQRTNVGVINAAFNNMQEKVDEIEKTIDSFQAEVENDLNEAKNDEIFIGEGSNNGDLVSCAVDGGVCLRYAGFKPTQNPSWMNETKLLGPKKAYKQLIKGDIIVCYPNCNLHEIVGYGNKSLKEIKEIRETLV